METREMTTNVAETTKPVAELPPVEYIRKALKSANQNALRIALYYQTRDPKLAQMEVEHVPVQGGAFVAHSISREDRVYVQEKALDFLLSGTAAKKDPTKQQSAELMELFTGYAPTPGQIDFGYEDLAFDDFSRSIDWTNGRPDEALKDFTGIPMVFVCYHPTCDCLSIVAKSGRSGFHYLSRREFCT